MSRKTKRTLLALAFMGTLVLSAVTSQFASAANWNTGDPTPTPTSAPAVNWNR